MIDSICKYFPELTPRQLEQLEALDPLYREWNAKINVISRKDMAILFPECEFKLIDGTGKKVMVAQEVCQHIGLTNCHPTHLRGEEEKGTYDFVVSRAVMPLPDLYRIARKNISRKQRNALPNGIICLKGGRMDEETQPFHNIVETTAISSFFSEEWFKEKYIIYLPC